MSTVDTRLLAATIAVLLSGCGDGGMGPGGAHVLTRVHLDSEPGDYIGQGEAYTYTQADSRIIVNQVGAAVRVNVAGDEDWNGSFRPAEAASRPEVGMFTDAVINWEGDHRTCGGTTGWFAVDSIRYTDGALTQIALRFEQFCGSETGPSLHGDIVWSAFDETSPPGPVDPPPSGLWAPVSGAVPSSGNYVYVSSEEGETIGDGADYLFTSPDDSIVVEGSNGIVSFAVEDASSSWSGTFEAMNVIERIETGYYPELQRWGFSNPLRGGFSWTGRSSGCNESRSWVVIDAVRFEGDLITAITMRFEQRCDGKEAALRGAVRWEDGG